MRKTENNRDEIGSRIVRAGTAMTGMAEPADAPGFDIVRQKRRE